MSKPTHRSLMSQLRQYLTPTQPVVADDVASLQADAAAIRAGWSSTPPAAPVPSSLVTVASTGPQLVHPASVLAVQQSAYAHGINQALQQAALNQHNVARQQAYANSVYAQQVQAHQQVLATHGVLAGFGGGGGSYSSSGALSGNGGAGGFGNYTSATTPFGGPSRYYEPPVPKWDPAWFNDYQSALEAASIGRMVEET